MTEKVQEVEGGEISFPILIQRPDPDSLCEAKEQEVKRLGVQEFRSSGVKEMESSGVQESNPRGLIRADFLKQKHK